MSASDGRIQGLDDYIERALNDRGIPGAAVAVVRQNEVVYAAGHGRKEIGQSDTIDEHTLFQVGSVTKSFTTTALGMLVDERKLHWDDPVIDYLPEFHLSDPWITRNLTIRDAVTHRSGFIAGGWAQSGIMDQDEAIRRMRYAKEFAPFRDSYNYSNEMYGVAGQVLKAASGITWNDFLKSRIFRPLGMGRSGTSPFEFWDAKYVAPTFFGTASAEHFTHRDSRDSNVAMPHTIEKGDASVIPWQSYDALAAAGSVVSSASEIARWLILHINNGRFEDRELLKEQTAVELHSPQNLRLETQEGGSFAFEARLSKYALGWRRGKHEGETLLWHGGGVLGFPAFAVFCPAQKVGVVVLANGSPLDPNLLIRNYDAHSSIALWVLDRFRRAPMRDWSAEFLQGMRSLQEQCERAETELQSTRLHDAPPSLPLAEYAGIYEDASKAMGSIEICVGKTGLALRLPGAGALSGRLQHWHRDMFRFDQNGYKYIRDFVSFELSPKGTVFGLQFYGTTFRRAAT